MFTDFIPYYERDKITKAVEVAKELFGENEPYVIESRAEGQVVIFHKHLILTIREALSTGCMAKMNAAEEELFWAFVEYQNGAAERDITRGSNNVLAALDKWFHDEANCLPHPKVNSCYDAGPHEYTTCNSNNNN